MAEIYEVLSKPTVLQYIKNRTYPPLMGQTLFPEVKKPDFEFEYIKGSGGLPVIAHLHAFDTEAEIGSRDGYEKVNFEAFMIKRKIRVDERNIIKLRTPRNDAEFKYVRDKLFNDIDNMVNAVRSRIEKCRMDVLAKGVLEIRENGVNKDVDYLVPDKNKPVLTGTDLWSSPDSDPLKDMLEWKEIVRDATGDVVTRALTSTKILMMLCNHPKIRKAMLGVNSEIIPTRIQLNAFLAEHELPRIAVNDTKYREETSQPGVYATHRYFPENKFVMMPDGLLGETIYGPTPEEGELMSDKSVDIRDVGNIIVEIYKTKDPVAHWTKAVALSAPSFPMADSVIQATVAASV